jgi:outer membrane lipoprotein LolB
MLKPLLKTKDIISMMRTLRITLCFFVATMVTGCTTIGLRPSQTAANTATTLPSPEEQAKQKHAEVALNQINSFQISGKVAVQTSKDAGSASVDWIQHPNQFKITLTGPLGSHRVVLVGGPGKVTLETAEGKHLSASSPEELLARHWGFRLPVSYIKYWIRGLPVPGIASQPQYDASHRLISLTQQNWHIEYLDYTHKQLFDLPSRLSITSPSLRAKIIIYRWSV